MPAKLTTGRHDGYDIYPAYALGKNKIFNGYAGFAAWIADRKFVAIDGYAGIFWADVRNGLEKAFAAQGLRPEWIAASGYLKPAHVIQEMVNPFLGTPGSVWGTRCNLSLRDFFLPPDAIARPGEQSITIVFGPGAALLAPAAHLAYIDLPKNELQLRMRAGSITNLGNDVAENAADMYKRFYFVDWIILNEHKKAILPRIELLADGQWKDIINWMEGVDFIDALHRLARQPFRVRPWFEPGAWGGQWMKEHIEGINREEVNYAWSFELIVPENGLVLESDGLLLEFSFDFLMFAGKDAVLGEYAARFGDEFPIRFDFLDTWDGGNLSIQCHPSPRYIQEHFGERITQDETYYILDCQPQANVYLGFQDDINPVSFRKALEQSRDEGAELPVARYVQSHAAHKHDLFLIPNGTIHSAGAGNLVLEISATPYIFTFKMYDWLRLDLNGEPRAINIEHAFNNLRFDRKGEKVREELISKPAVINKGADWQIVHLPTHREHFYDVERLEFDSSLAVETAGSCHVLMLVEGTAVKVITAAGIEQVYHYAETFVIPAAVRSYTIVNVGAGRAKLVKAFIKS